MGVDVACDVEAQTELERAELCFGTRRDLFKAKLDSIRAQRRAGRISGMRFRLLGIFERTLSMLGILL